MQLLEFSDSGIYCPAGDFFIDPWRPVKCALITHGHSDHARWGNTHYITDNETVPILKYRIAADISVQGYGGHIHFTGTALVKAEKQDSVYVVVESVVLKV
jgi:putative mRNA 3-end processing factor